MRQTLSAYEGVEVISPVSPAEIDKDGNPLRSGYSSRRAYHLAEAGFRAYDRGTAGGGYDIAGIG
jgi:hypothetical protein